MATLGMSGGLIDAVITDISMPVMNGLELLNVIRAGGAKVRHDLSAAGFTGFGVMGFVGAAMRSTPMHSS